MPKKTKQNQTNKKTRTNKQTEKHMSDEYTSQKTLFIDSLEQPDISNHVSGIP